MEGVGCRKPGIQAWESVKWSLNNPLRKAEVGRQGSMGQNGI